MNLNGRLYSIILITVFKNSLQDKIGENRDGNGLKECSITSYGKDGFGHQVEGKLSCIIASELHPRLSYVHIPFGEMEHTPDLNKQAEEFINLGYKRVQEKDLSLKRHILTNAAWTRQAAYQNAECSPSILYAVDNCWDLIYKNPMVRQIDKIIPKLQEMYFSTPKPDTGFIYGKFNIAVHIRRGDSGDRALAVEYYENGIKHYLKNVSNPILWIMTDDPHWKGIHKLVSLFPDLTIHRPNNKKQLFLEFHRMVMSQGLILSESSLSISAALISNCSNIVTYENSIQWSKIRGKWFESTSRFVRIPRGPLEISEVP